MERIPAVLALLNVFLKSSFKKHFLYLKYHADDIWSDLTLATMLWANLFLKPSCQYRVDLSDGIKLSLLSYDKGFKKKKNTQ